jgi:hypothetical protein
MWRREERKGRHRRQVAKSKAGREMTKCPEDE